MLFLNQSTSLKPATTESCDCGWMLTQLNILSEKKLSYTLNELACLPKCPLYLTFKPWTLKKCGLEIE